MFENIIGHKNQLSKLEEMVKNNTLVNSYLFLGKQGIGKKLVAIDFAKYILNVDNLNGSMDYKYIEKQEGKKDITVDQVRKMIVDDVYIKPSIGNKKVYIINDAQNLNEEAQNTLLKTLEEPPYYVIIILIASNIKSFLPTVLSRLYMFNFMPLNNNEMLNYAKQKYDQIIDSDILEFVDGSIGKLEQIYGDSENETFNNIKKIFSLLEKKDTINSLLNIVNIDFKQDNYLDYLEYLMYKNKKYNCVDIIENSKKRLKNNGNYDIVINTMVLKIIDVI